MQLAFSTLWGSPTDRATEQHQPFATAQDAKTARDAEYRRLKAEGKQVRRWTLRGQLRQYWSFGVPCNDMCDVYMLDVVVAR